MAASNSPLEYTLWSESPASATSLNRAKSAFSASGTRCAVSASSAFFCSSSAVLPWAAERGSRDAPVACVEMAAQASAAEA
jgi:hypothetical protein